ncbi:MAG TPA: PIN domain-containing protein [Ktedonobacteraceae bacterium]|nr:PIN domain-containing protein [Ktedonobacteraceae bacterium]
MGWVDSLSGKVVGLDTAPVIYYIERNPQYIEMLRLFFQAVDRGDCSVVSSIVTFLEGLVIPIRQGNTDLVRQYHNLLFKTKGLKTIFLDQQIAEEAARLRAFHKIRTPDSIQVATAITMEAAFFLTNDKRLPSLPNLKILMLDDLLKEGQEKES